VKPSTVHSIISFLYRHLTRVQVEGRENIPAQGACLLATNHMSRLDVPLLFIATPRLDLVALIADKYKMNLGISFLVRATGSIWLDREKADFTAFRAALEVLRKGWVLGIAPEGTRSTVRALLPAKTGIAFLAEKAGVPVVPAAICGTETSMNQILHLKRPVLRVRYGEAFQLPPIERQDREASLQRNTHEIMCRIAAMLPPRYWGHYAGHPRLAELLRSNPHEVENR
jgi:1-acyl-sn-glycerol-3-phosphate acyltransferase